MNGEGVRRTARIFSVIHTLNAIDSRRRILLGSRRECMDRYDLLVIGGGAAGINALKHGVKLGARVALVDSGPLGGACINRG